MDSVITIGENVFVCFNIHSNKTIESNFMSLFARLCNNNSGNSIKIYMLTYLLQQKAHILLKLNVIREIFKWVIVMLDFI